MASKLSTSHMWNYLYKDNMCIQCYSIGKCCGSSVSTTGIFSLCFPIESPSPPFSDGAWIFESDLFYLHRNEMQIYRRLRCLANGQLILWKCFLHLINCVSSRNGIFFPPFSPLSFLFCWLVSLLPLCPFLPSLFHDRVSFLTVNCWAVIFIILPYFHPILQLSCVHTLCNFIYSRTPAFITSGSTHENAKGRTPAAASARSPQRPFHV